MLKKIKPLPNSQRLKTYTPEKKAAGNVADRGKLTRVRVARSRDHLEICGSYSRKWIDWASLKGLRAAGSTDVRLVYSLFGYADFNLHREDAIPCHGQRQGPGIVKRTPVKRFTGELSIV